MGDLKPAWATQQDPISYNNNWGGEYNFLTHSEPRLGL